MSDKPIYIVVSGQTIEAPTDLPPRRFREAFALDQGTITIDPVKQREIFVREVKAEAGRRILALAPEHKQRNVTARGVELMPKKIAGTLTAEEQAEWDAGQALWDAIKAIRARSNVLEQGDILDEITLRADATWAVS